MPLIRMDDNYGGPRGPHRFNSLPNGERIALVPWPDGQKIRPRVAYRPRWIADYVLEEEIERGPGAQTRRALLVRKTKDVPDERVSEIKAGFETEPPSSSPDDPLAGVTTPFVRTVAKARRDKGLFACPPGYYLHSTPGGMAICARQDLQPQVRTIRGEVVIFDAQESRIVARASDFPVGGGSIETGAPGGGAPTLGGPGRPQRATSVNRAMDATGRPPAPAPRVIHPGTLSPGELPVAIHEGPLVDGEGDGDDAESTSTKAGVGLLALLAGLLWAGR